MHSAVFFVGINDYRSEILFTQLLYDMYDIRYIISGMHRKRIKILDAIWASCINRFQY